MLLNLQNDEEGVNRLEFINMFVELISQNLRFPLFLSLTEKTIINFVMNIIVILYLYNLFCMKILSASFSSTLYISKAL